MDSRCYEGNAIGTYGEHSVHYALKYLLEPNAEYHERSFMGFVADIKNSGGIIEIQTKSFERLNKKLAAFLPCTPVKIVFPAIRKKDIVWIDPITGEATKPRRSPKVGTIQAVLPELYKIRQHLNHPNLEIWVIPVDVEDLRLLNGWSTDRKRGSVRKETLPIAFGECVRILTSADYVMLIPEELPSVFTAKMFAKAAKLSQRKSWYSLQVLLSLACISRCGKKENAFLYSRG